MDFSFINCKLNDVFFNTEELTNLKFDNSQLQNVWFSASLLDNVKIKNSTLENIICDGTQAYKEVYINGVLTAKPILIKDYASFLKEIS